RRARLRSFVASRTRGTRIARGSRRRCQGSPPTDADGSLRTSVGEGAAMSRLLRRTLIGVGLGIVVYAVALIYFDARSVADALKGFGWSAVVIALLASSVNYLLRFVKWELCLRWLEIRGEGEGQAPNLGLGRSFVIYIAGLSMSVTPGKVGEGLRSVLLKASDGVPFARTAPIVVADRATD